MASSTAPPSPADADRAAALRSRAFAAKREWHQAQAEGSPRAKIEILLRLQREIVPILRARRELLPHEKPWTILP
jgi:hypothetical protein